MNDQVNDEQSKSPPDLPIRIAYGEEALDWGIASIPKVILWFYRHLRCDGEKLDDREVMPLVLLISLWEDREEPLRLSNLPSSTPWRTLEDRYLRKWRRMGLVFTRRVYYTREEMLAVFGKDLPPTPRQKARIFDVSSLVHNCIRVARIWQEEGYPQAYQAWQEEWQASQVTGREPPDPPHPRFPPPDFTVEVELPDALVAAIIGGQYQFVPGKWRKRAREAAEAVPAQIMRVRERTRTDRAGTEPRIRTNRAGTEPRTRTNRAGHLGSTSLREGTLSADAESGPPGGPQPPLSEQMFQLSPPAAAGTGSPGRLPTGEAAKGQAGPAGVPCQGVGESPARPAGSRVEPLPERRRRVLADLRRVRNRRKRVAIVTQNIGQILGLGLDDGGALRTRPTKSDYARIGRMMREYGDETVWLTACRAAGAAVEGDPLAYLEACLRHERQGSQSGRERGRSRRDDYPETPDEYGDGWTV